MTRGVAVGVTPFEFGPRVTNYIFLDQSRSFGTPVLKLNQSNYPIPGGRQRRETKCLGISKCFHDHRSTAHRPALDLAVKNPFKFAKIAWVISNH